MHHRDDMLRRLEHERFDVLVIGGGATGAGCALDAASRGLSVALVERDDFAAGTSSRSTKLIHGGVRYLEQAVKQFDRGQYHLVRDALAERATLLRLAPHLVRTRRILTPLYRWIDVPYLAAGFKLYDWIAGSANLEPSRLLSIRDARRRMPILNGEHLRGAVVYSDGQFDDARLNIAIALTAVEHGAAALNYIGVVDFQKARGRITAALVEDRLTGRRFDVRARAFINATGPFSDAVRRLDEPDAEPMLTVSSGVHLVLDRACADPQLGLLVPRTDDGRVLFLLPWQGHALLGTTDLPADPEPHPRVHEHEIRYLLKQVLPYLNQRIDPAHIRAVWCGLRPLVAPGGDGSELGTAKLSRDHTVVTSASGLVTITGGKWTTYRRMAADAVSDAVRAASLQLRNDSQTATLPLVGGRDFEPDGWRDLAATFGLDDDVARHLHVAYGDVAPQVAQMAARGHSPRLAEGHPYIEAEVIHAVRHELACTALDVLARRTRLAFVDRIVAERALPRVVELMAAELNWNASRITRERERVRERLMHGL